MHCPRCGQLQNNEETKFCSRCGFPLKLVSEILSHGGFLPELADLHSNKKLPTKKHGVIFSVFWCMFFVLILTPIGAMLNIDALAGGSAVIGIFGGLMLFIASRMLLESDSNQNSYQAGQLAGQNYQPLNQPQQTALPSPVENYVSPMGEWRAPNTDDLVERGSVTDNTTKLLYKEK